MRFDNRSDAGRKLAMQLAAYRTADCVVLALPRGGVPVGFEVAQALQKPLDILVVRKIGMPGQEELALGAMGPQGGVVWNADLLGCFNLTPQDVQGVVSQEQAELTRRLAVFRGVRPYPSLRNKTVLLVDDGLATGASVRAALQSLGSMHPAKVVLAIPVGAKSTVAQLRPCVDELVCLLEPEELHSVGEWYRDFTQTSDQAVISLLQRAWHDEKIREG